jgi:hypothetical protein
MNITLKGYRRYPKADQQFALSFQKLIPWTNSKVSPLMPLCLLVRGGTVNYSSFASGQFSKESCYKYNRVYDLHTICTIKPLIHVTTVKQTAGLHVIQASDTEVSYAQRIRLLKMVTAWPLRMLGCGGTV